MVYILGVDPLTKFVYEFEPKRDSQCVVLRTENMRVNQGSLKEFLHKITFGHYNPRIQFDLALLRDLIAESEEL